MTPDDHEPPSSPDTSNFEDVDWSSEHRLGLLEVVRLPVMTILFAAMVIPVIHDLYGPDTGEIVLWRWDFALNEWMYLLALVLIGLYLLGAVLHSPGTLRIYANRFSRSWVALFFGAVTLALFAIATFGPMLIEYPGTDIGHRYQPPPGFTIESYYINDCIGPVDDELMCHGTWERPFGTQTVGRDILPYSVFGLRTSFFIGFTATVIAVTIGTTLGTIAAFLGGWVEAVIMRLVDFMHAIPAFFVYALLAAIMMGAGGDLVVMTLIFGLLSWGGIARLVRSEVLQRRQELFVKSAESAGAPTGYILRRHILPNTTNTVLTAATMLVPTFMIFEAALSFLDLGDPNPDVVSLGDDIRRGFEAEILSAFDIWWTWAIPGALLVIMLLAVTITGDAIRDATDPRL